MSERFAGRRFSWLRFSALLAVCAALVGAAWYAWCSARDEA